VGRCRYAPLRRDRPTNLVPDDGCTSENRVSIATLRCGRPTDSAKINIPLFETFQSQLCDAADLPPEDRKVPRPQPDDRFNRNSAMRPTYQVGNDGHLSAQKAFQ